MSQSIRRVDISSADFVKEQWNSIASQRDIQLRSGRDISFTHVLTPAIIRMMAGEDMSYVLDAGCGSGVMAEIISGYAKRITAIDIAEKNIELAIASKARKENIEYLSESIEQHAQKAGEAYSLIYANMVLQDVMCLDSIADSLAKISRSGTAFIATVTHPWFWPFYWDYHEKEWFKYDEEFAVVAPYKISGDEGPIGTTTHFHRPLHRYVSALENSGFSIVSIEEPMPDEEAASEYKVPWRFPRFLAMKFVFK